MNIIVICAQTNQPLTTCPFNYTQNFDSCFVHHTKNSPTKQCHLHYCKKD